ncbi:hypothetical protein Tco_1236580 [Tanacetum coccineum]
MPVSWRGSHTWIVVAAMVGVDDLSTLLFQCAEGGMMVESESESPQQRPQPPQAHPWHGLMRARFITSLLTRRINP